MLSCMTGFAKTELKDKKYDIYIEIKSLNHKFLDLTFNLPEEFSYLEPILRKEIEKKIKRGKVWVFLKIRPKCLEELVDKDLVRRYFLILEELRKDLNLKENITLDTLLNLKGVLKEGVLEKDKVIEEKIKNAFMRTLETLLSSRRSSGKMVSKFLKKQAQKIKKKLFSLEKRSIKVSKEKAKLIENPEEKINFLKSSDVTEELNLLKFHLNNLEKKIEVDYPVGKELDFITQEMQREINTLASKSFDPEVSGLSIFIKTEIEKMREQIQNVE
jgi:uncharacterized protein (TIGR00255 family)